MAFIIDILATHEQLGLEDELFNALIRTTMWLLICQNTTVGDWSKMRSETGWKEWYGVAKRYWEALDHKATKCSTVSCLSQNRE
ncbi:hypothetical protein PsorP6_001079 [Peronosclerospora sorghi]|uniref:Uncharacterized protein n=1 Tax=Peronosclerospora sorghi TaxID=230839 RepID=A0ACC0WWI1_9STRA|nr:hypothetical protein PsorP6_001079 [Peronosclerospora sorghi]